LNFRISSKDLEAIRKRALEEGLPYQTLIVSFLYKYVSGRLKEAWRRHPSEIGTMNLSANVFDVWVFQRRPGGVVFLLLRTSQEKAARHFNGGRFWQIPSDFVNDGESITDAICRALGRHQLRPTSIWAGEHAYLIYNRRFAEMQVIGVYAAEVAGDEVRLDSAHSEYEWLPFETCLERIHFRGLKDGLRSVHEYITGASDPARELLLYAAPSGAPS
jgi:hypothetical protein